MEGHSIFKFLVIASGSTGLRETALAFLATEPWSNHTPQSSRGRELGRKECRQLPRSAQQRRKPRAYHSFLGPEWAEPDSQKKDFGSSETLKVLISKSLEEEKSIQVGRRQERTSLGWPQTASSKQWLYLNVSKSLREALNY